MALLSNLLAALSGSRRSVLTGSGWNRGRSSYGRRPRGYGYRGRQSTGAGGSFGRMLLAGLGAYGLRRFFNSRSRVTGY
ncbi:hypothetical protein D7Y13_39185 [Corallococcus praedator]|uniref:Uncharacterized protein n=1 Tax=Corallococcus praedator TaxID=2316724 RepID=A0ABX9Q747_9BACT|nr:MULTISPECIES: hypothetical protein [Corallococcus]RKH13148.1 hypothetical protein D7X74_22415 [Corallococcus sp. CA047B]RKH27136.1 hypothetical protein D7X75_26995 [Corallococcus sp. CA031C]RKH91037.1 hypothetical protein D7Y13_39185 [Corallococcus praedator]